MNAETLIDNPSDSGGVAARAGFTFQDHVGVGLLLDMLSNQTILAVEFETSDDITLRIQEDGQDINEYVQVKSTEGDSKWNLKEILNRDKSGKKPVVGSSLCEKSLACDKFAAQARFRLVTRRDVAKLLKPFCVPRDKRRTVKANLDDLQQRFAAKHKTFNSKNGRTLGDWAALLYWHVAESAEAIESKSVGRILRLCENLGSPPLHSKALYIYRELLSQVRDASEASRTSAADDKSIDRVTLLSWWEKQLVDIRSSTRLNLKVYTILPEPFLKEIFQQDDAAIKRSVKSFDVDFDDGEWRSEALCDYLLDWLPEIALPSKTLAQFDRFAARRLLPAAKAALSGKKIDNGALLAETLLHAVMRNHLNSEPIPCRLFSMDDGTGTSAHIVFDAAGDQLWLGRPRLIPMDQREVILLEIMTSIENAVTSGVLKKERTFVMSLREPQHARPSTIDDLLSDRAKIEDLRKSVRLPVLLAYESSHLNVAFYKDYLEDLIAETQRQYLEIKNHLPNSLRDISVYIFLIPIHSVERLTADFTKALDS